MNNVFHCTVAGCKTTMLSTITYLPSLWKIARETEKDVADLTTTDLESRAVCDDCARRGRKSGGEFFPYESSLRLIQRLRQKRQERLDSQQQRQERQEARHLAATRPCTAPIGDIVAEERRVNSRAISRAEDAQIARMHERAELAARNDTLRAAASA